MNANSLRQLPLGETCKDTSCPQLSPGDDVRHGSASIYLPMEGNCNRGGARGAGACAQPRQRGGLAVGWFVVISKSLITFECCHERSTLRPSSHLNVLRGFQTCRLFGDAGFERGNLAGESFELVGHFDVPFSQLRTCSYSGKSQAGDVVTGRGVSYCKYELVRTYIAVIAEVEVKRSTGEIHATRFYVAHDCGQIINPDGVKNQIEGNVIQTVSRTLKEELKFSRSAVTSLDWASYPILTFPEVPDIVIELIDHPTEKPWGTGEPSAAVVPSAISNAVFDATGVRLRSVPFTSEKVRETLRRGA